MAQARWWEPLTRLWRGEPAATAAASVSRTATPAAAQAPLAPATTPATPAAATVAAAAKAAAEASAPAVETVPEEPLPSRNLRFFRWMLGVAPRGDAPLPGAIVEEMLAQLDAVIASESERAALLPRAPHVVPQLMKTLRDERYSAADVASRISRDVVLTAEVVRSATSMLQRGDDGEEIDLARAVAVVGTQGLRRAIANVVLRPIFDSRGSSLSARAATQIWKDADRKARLCGALAGEAALDPFDGYLAGLLHNSGWTAVLRAIDTLRDIDVSAAELAHPELVAHIVRRRDALFGAFVGQWNLGAAMDALAAEVGAAGLEGAASPLGLALREADRLAALRALAPAGEKAASVVPRWSSLAKPVQDCYDEMVAAS